MSAKYTSYATSLALREAGVVQEGAERVWYWSVTSGGERLIPDFDATPEERVRLGVARAYRLDELVDLLWPYVVDPLHFLVLRASDQSVRVSFDSLNDDIGTARVDSGLHASPVEAAAACLLAVARARDQARPSTHADDCACANDDVEHTADCRNCDCGLKDRAREVTK